VEDVKFVINFDYPNCSEDYVHRIGRTARSNRKGTAYTFFTMSNMKQAGDLISVLQEANQAVNPQLFDLVDMSKNSYGGGGRSRSRWRNPNDKNGNMPSRGFDRSQSARGDRRGGGRGGGGGRSDRNGYGNRGGYQASNGYQNGY